MQPLFNDEGQLEGILDQQDEVNVKDTAQLAQYIGVIEKIETQQAEVLKQAKEAQAYYNRRIATGEKAIEHIKGLISGWLRYHNMKSIATHRGTAFFGQGKGSLHYNESSPIVIEWARQNGCLETKEYVSKAKILEYEKNGGKLPDAITRVEGETSLRIRSQRELIPEAVEQEL